MKRKSQEWFRLVLWEFDTLAITHNSPAHIHTRKVGKRKGEIRERIKEVQVHTHTQPFKLLNRTREIDVFLLALLVTVLVVLSSKSVVSMARLVCLPKEQRKWKNFGIQSAAFLLWEVSLFFACIKEIYYFAFHFIHFNSLAVLASAFAPVFLNV